MDGWYDRDGNPIGAEMAMLLRYGNEGTVSDYARIGLDEFDGVKVSTVWLGLDHNLGLHGEKPLIFETMIFGGDHSEDCYRYSTKEEALDGHNTVVENLRNGRDPW